MRYTKHKSWFQQSLIGARLSSLTTEQPFHGLSVQLPQRQLLEQQSCETLPGEGSQGLGFGLQAQKFVSRPESPQEEKTAPQSRSPATVPSVCQCAA